jgi:hypothetical protein
MLLHDGCVLLLCLLFSMQLLIIIFRIIFLSISFINTGFGISSIDPVSFIDSCLVTHFVL